MRDGFRTLLDFIFALHSTQQSIQLSMFLIFNQLLVPATRYIIPAWQILFGGCMGWGAIRSA
jgi:hypothetical protein